MTRFFSDNKPLFFLGASFLPFYFFIAFFYNFLNQGILTDKNLDLLLGFGLFFVYLIYFFSWQALKNRPWPKESLKLIFIFSLGFIAFMFWAVPVGGSDFYHYFFEDTALIFYHQNPFFTAPQDLPFEPLTHLSYWHFLPVQHGPARLFMTLPAAFLSGQNIVLGLLFYKIIFAFFLIACNFLVYKILVNLRVKNFYLPLLLFVWNPLIIYETFINGGTDILMVFWLLLSIYFLIRNIFFWSIIALALSVLVKYITLIFFPFFLVYILAQKPLFKHKAAYFFGLSALFVAVLAACFWPFWGGSETLAGIFWTANFFDVNSFPGFVSLLFFLANPGLDIYSFKIIFEVLFFLVYLFLLFKFFRQKNPKPQDLIYYLFLVLAWFLLLGKFWFYIKYLIWLLPLTLFLDKKFYPLAVFLTGAVVLSPLRPNLMIIAVIPPVLVFCFYYYLKNFTRKLT